MSKQPKSATDWERVKRESRREAPIPHHPADGPYDPNNDQAAAEYLATALRRRRGERGPQKAPTKQKVTLRLTQEVLTHFRKSGPGWQTRIDELLLKAIRKRRAS
jgi:uncharacterized protein (DUF4415 family)